MASIDETYSLTGYEPNAYDLVLHRAPHLAAVPLQARVSRERRIR